MTNESKPKSHDLGPMSDRFVIIETRDEATAIYWWNFMKDWVNKKNGIKTIWLARSGDWVPGFNDASRAPPSGGQVSDSEVQ